MINRENRHLHRLKPAYWQQLVIALKWTVILVQDYNFYRE